MTNTLGLRVGSWELESWTSDQKKRKAQDWFKSEDRNIVRVQARLHQNLIICTVNAFQKSGKPQEGDIPNG